MPSIHTLEQSSRRFSCLGVLRAGRVRVASYVHSDGMKGRTNRRLPGTSHIVWHDQDRERCRNRSRVSWHIGRRLCPDDPAHCGSRPLRRTDNLTSQNPLNTMMQSRVWRILKKTITPIFQVLDFSASIADEGSDPERQDFFPRRALGRLQPRMTPSLGCAITLILPTVIAASRRGNWRHLRVDLR